MTVSDLFQIGLFFGVLLALVRPLGGFMARVYGGERTLLAPLGMQRNQIRR